MDEDKTDNWKTWFDDETRKLRPGITKDGTQVTGKRRYLHFDRRVTVLDETKTRRALEPATVANRSFYPFIRVDTREKRYRRRKGHVKGDRTRIKTSKLRPIDYASHQDALVYSWYAYLLSAFYEQVVAQLGIGDNVIAYRTFKTKANDKGKTNVDFASNAFTFMQKNTPCRILAIDITKYYEEIDHEILKKQWGRVLNVERLPSDHFNVFKSVTKYRFVRRDRIVQHIDRARGKSRDRICSPAEFKKWIIDKNLQERGGAAEKTIGIPQGAPISCVLANVYMLDFDTAVAAAIRMVGGLYLRYSDDILIVCGPEAADKIEALVMSEIDKLKLRIQPAKTEHYICEARDGSPRLLDLKTMEATRLQYLGIETDGTNHYLRHAGLARFERRRNRAVKRTVQNAYQKQKAIPKRSLHIKYAIPKGNYLAYAKRAENILRTGKISHQVSVVREARRLKLSISQKLKAAKRLSS